MLHPGMISGREQEAEADLVEHVDALASGATSIRAPSASSTSADPHCELTLRLPCLATGSPAAAATKALAVETLIIPDPSPPVPQQSANR